MERTVLRVFAPFPCRRPLGRDRDRRWGARVDGDVVQPDRVEGLDADGRRLQRDIQRSTVCRNLPERADIRG